jgi:hypothetical protein
MMKSMTLMMTAAIVMGGLVSVAPAQRVNVPVAGTWKVASGSYVTQKGVSASIRRKPTSYTSTDLERFKMTFSPMAANQRTHFNFAWTGVPADFPPGQSEVEGTAKFQRKQSDRNSMLFDLDFEFRNQNTTTIYRCLASFESTINNGRQLIILMPSESANAETSNERAPANAKRPINFESVNRGMARLLLLQPDD